jgi:hypothetical protein
MGDQVSQQQEDHGHVGQISVLRGQLKLDQKLSDIAKDNGKGNVKGKGKGGGKTKNKKNTGNKTKTNQKKDEAWKKIPPKDGDMKSKAI